ncbi:MAG: hypothetical protein RLZZ387_752 [Chloroflexota bacterium]
MSDVRWDAADGVLIARLSGAVSVVDVERWKAELGATLARIPDGTTFRLLSDLFGYEPADLEAHKLKRCTLPEPVRAARRRVEEPVHHRVVERCECAEAERGMTLPPHDLPSRRLRAPDAVGRQALCWRAHHRHASAALR